MSGERISLWSPCYFANGKVEGVKGGRQWGRGRNDINQTRKSHNENTRIVYLFSRFGLGDEAVKRRGRGNICFMQLLFLKTKNKEMTAEQKKNRFIYHIAP